MSKAKRAIFHFFGEDRAPGQSTTCLADAEVPGTSVVLQTSINLTVHHLILTWVFTWITVFDPEGPNYARSVLGDGAAKCLQS